MLTLKVITEETEKVIKGLEKKHFPDAQEAVDHAIALDKVRRETQTQLDASLAESKKFAAQIGALMKQGIKLLLMDVQKDFVHDSDRIFAKDKIPYTPIDEAQAVIISCEESRTFLMQMGISGGIIPTSSHSADSVSLLLDDGDCLAGDLEPFEYLEAYGENPKLKEDWERILSFHPKRICFAHRPEINVD